MSELCFHPMRGGTFGISKSILHIFSMNNLRLLTGLFAVVLVSGGVCSWGQTVLSIEELFEIAEANSAQLRPFFSAQEEAEKDIKVAQSGRLPDITSALSLSYIGDGFTTDRKMSDYQIASIPHFGNTFAVNITQPIYTGGALTNSVQLAELKSTASRYSTELQRDNIRFQLTGFYLDIYKYSNLRKVVDGNLSAAHKVLEDMKARYEQGTALKNDIIRYELLVSDLGLELIKIDNMLEILNNNLITVAGLPENTIVVPDTTILSRSLPHNDVCWWQSRAESNSPSLNLARIGVDISRKGERLVKADRLPKIGLQAGWSIDGPILTEVPPINRNLSYWYVGIGLSYNISSIYKTNKTIDKSRSATRHSIELYDAARDNLSMSVRADYIKYLEAYEELKTQEKSVELAEQNYNTIATRYSEDMALITDMLDAANARLDAQQRLVNTRINTIYYYYKLLFITGEI